MEGIGIIILPISIMIIPLLFCCSSFFPLQKYPPNLFKNKFEISKPDLQQDTSKMFYYSFQLEKVIDLNNEKLSSLFETLEVCEGSKVLLEAPRMEESGLLFWEGPNGFRSYQRKIYFENANAKQSGRYTLRIFKDNKIFGGMIDLIINESPKASYDFSQTAEEINLLAFNKEQEYTYEWKDKDNLSLGKLAALKMKQKSSFKEPIFLLVYNKACENKYKIKLN